ncbi:MAG TPA: sialidase family protein, partial [Candidatus Thermoplasmatota archaeon]|nr:sialidase family protein [Candidatus Thermoplasmatota archaeon]
AAEPHVAINPVDPSHIVAGAADYGNPLGGPWCGAYVSRDGGATWTRNLLPGFPGDTRPPEGRPLVDNLYGFGYCGDSVLAFSPDGATVYYAGIAFHPPPLYNVALFVARSTDGGDTWEDVTILNYGASTVVFNDKEWLVVDPDSGNLYMTWTLFSLPPAEVPTVLESRGPIQFTSSTDGGRTWTRPVLLSRTEFNQGSVPVVLPGGAIGVQWIEYPDGGENPNLVFARSDDAGATWTEPVVVATTVPVPAKLPNGNFRTPTLPALAADRSNGTTSGYLYSVWQDYARNHSDVLVSVSRDGGATWSPGLPVHNATDGTDQFFPWVTVDGRGVVHVAYMDRSADPENTRFGAAIATSLDGGLTWTTRRVSDADSNPEGGTAFLGDYVGLTSDAAGNVVFVWPDLRHTEPTASQRVDLFAARLAP